MTGCEESNAASNDQQITPDTQSESKAEVKPIESNEIKQVLDSVNALGSQIKAISNRQETNADKLNQVTEEISDFKASSNLYDWISWAVAAIALLTAIIALINFNSVKKRANRHRKEIEELKCKVNSIEQKTVTSVTRQTRATNMGLNGSEYNSLASRISLLERQLVKIERSKESVSQNPVHGNPISNICQPVKEQSGYFGLPNKISMTEAYFRRLSDIREADSRFAVKVKNDKAEFQPLEGTRYFNDLISSDSIKMAVDMQGCVPSEATQMRLIRFGEAKKEGDRWIITQKAIIELSR